MKIIKIVLATCTVLLFTACGSGDSGSAENVQALELPTNVNIVQEEE
jgi:hypothetical protein